MWMADMDGIPNYGTTEHNIPYNDINLINGKREKKKNEQEQKTPHFELK